jgi:hypothetical protein
MNKLGFLLAVRKYQMRFLLTLLITLLGFASASWAVPSVPYTYFQLDEVDKDGHTLTIKFRGARYGNIVIGLNEIYAWLDGDQLGLGQQPGGQLLNYYWRPESGRWGSGGAQVSFDGKENNFLFNDMEFTPCVNKACFQFNTGGDYVYDVSMFPKDFLFLPPDDPAVYSWASMGRHQTSGAFNYHDGVTYSLTISEPSTAVLIALGLLGSFVSIRRSAVRARQVGA